MPNETMSYTMQDASNGGETKSAAADSDDDKPLSVLSAAGGSGGCGARRAAKAVPVAKGIWADVFMSLGGRNAFGRIYRGTVESDVPNAAGAWKDRKSVV